jgi:prefoldin subunit 5
METPTIIALISEIVTVIVAIGGSWVAVKTLLARHDEKIDRIEKDIDEIKEERKSIDQDLKNIFRLISKIDKNVAVIEERTKK